MLILFSMQQSFRLESPGFSERRKKKRNFENVALLFHSLMDFGKELLAVPHSWYTRSGVLILHVFTLLNIDNFAFLYFSVLYLSAGLQIFFVSDPTTLLHSLCYFSGEIWKWKTHHRWIKCKAQVESHRVTQFEKRKKKGHRSVSEQLSGCSFPTGCAEFPGTEPVPCSHARGWARQNNQH